MRPSQALALVAALVASMLVLVLDRADAAFPGGNGKLAFTRYQGGEWPTEEIYVMYPDGESTSLTPDPWMNYDGEPAWSPDGTKIAFYSRGGSDGDGIYVMNADGTGRTYLGVGSRPAWSPDGTKIAINGISVMNADGTGRTYLGAGSDPAWSPDGNKIAFTTDRDGNAEIYVMNADGTAPTNLTKSASHDSGPSWSSDGTKIAFATGRDGNAEIYVMNADGTGPTNLTNSTSSDGQPAWSPDGKQIAFATNRESSWYAFNDVFVMNADGTGQTNVTKTTDYDEYEPDWQPLPGADSSPPDTTITSATTNANTAEFQFISSETGSTFECRIDAGAFTPCQSPAWYDGLPTGDRTFAVRARDASGNADSTPAEYKWTITDVLPQTWIQESIFGCNGSPTCVAFRFYSSQSDATFECRLDEAAWEGCWSPKVYDPAPAGEHTFAVRAIDTQGRADPSPATQAFTGSTSTDTTPPDTTITSGPSSTTMDNTPTFEFTSSEAGSTFECSLDGASFAACTSPHTTVVLANGSHTFSVKAKDVAGNVDTSPATRSFTVDVPAISIGDVSAKEGKTGTKTFWFTVKLSKASTETVTVAYTTADGTATLANSDYTATSGTLTFSPGETSKTISVAVKGDRNKEPDETFYVNLSDPTNATIADGQGDGTIKNDD